MDARFRIELFGGLRALVGDRDVTRFRTQKTGSLLAYLAFYPHKIHYREILIEILWPDVSPEAGRNSLSVALSSLRQLLEPAGVEASSVLRADRFTVQLDPSAIVTDVAEFEGALRAPDVLEANCHAFELYRGTLLAGYYEEWIGLEQERLAEQFFRAVQRLLAHLIQAGRHDEALDYARRSVAVDPLREEFHMALMQFLAARGRSSDALRQFREMERLLCERLGEEPSSSARALQAELQRRCVEEDNEDIPAMALPLLSPSPLQSGTVTLLFAEFEGADSPDTEEERRAFQQQWRDYCARIKPQIRRRGGQFVEEENEGFVAAFSGAAEALACVLHAPHAIREAGEQGEDSPLPPAALRMALHTGDIRADGEAKNSSTWDHTKRLLAAGHGGQILCSETTASLARPELGAGDQLVDLGLYRLQGEAIPERLFQVRGPELPEREFPPLKAATGYARRLPLARTRFFGREDEIARLKSLLAPRSIGGLEPWSQTTSDTSPFPARLITLTGLGGSGKTRLALAVAEQLLETFSGAVWFVPLADLTDACRIGDVIADCLQLPRLAMAEPLERVAEFLNGLKNPEPASGVRARTPLAPDLTPSLLVLDNFEHLVEAGAEILQTLLERVPTCTCLVTSRRRLAIQGEQEFRVAPLPVPDEGTRAKEHQTGRGKSVTRTDLPARWPTQLMQCPSIRLFVDRAQSARSDFQLTAGNQQVVAELSRRLEGIPLALEMAAARTAVMSPAQMLSRLSERADLLVSRQRDIPERHRTLRATLDWSYDLLAPELRRFFAQLSVFRGGWTLEAVEAICIDEEHVVDAESGNRTVDVLDYLAQLSDGSLIQAEESEGGLRFRMLEMLREYAWEHLDEDERTALRQRHLAFFLALAETAASHLKEPEQVAWLDRLEAEHDNLSVALQFSIERIDSLASPNPLASPPPRDAGLRLCGALQPFWGTRGHLSEGRKWSESALSQPRLRERTKWRAKALDGSGALSRMQSDYISARSLHEEGLSIYREIGDREGVASSLNNLGSVARQQGDYAAARAFYEESLAIHREMKNRGAMAGPLSNLGNVAHSQGDFMAARALYEEALVLNQEAGNRAWVALNLNGLGNVAHSQGSYAAARALYEEGLAIRRELGDPRSLVLPLASLAALTREQGDYELARTYLAECLVLCRQLEIRYVAALCLDNFAVLVQAQGQPERAACLHGAAAALRERIGAALSPENRKEVERELNALRISLGETTFTAAFASGRGLDWQHAIANVLEEGPE